MRTQAVSHERGNVIHRFVKHHRVLWVPAGWLSLVVASSPESSPVRSILGPLRDRLRGAMKIDDVQRVLSAFEAHDVPVYLAGGWGIDALLGRQTRSHDDLDIVIDDYEHQVKRALEALAPLGFRLIASYERRAWMPRIAVLEDNTGRCIDLNSLDWKRLADEVGPFGTYGGARSACEQRVFSEGTLGDRRVPCLALDVQLLYHTAFELSASHRRDLDLLRRELGEPDPEGTTGGRTRGTVRRRPLGTPCVVFLDDCRWNAFHQLAPKLRRAGVRTMRVSTDRHRMTRIASWLLFDRYVILSESNAGVLREILASENVVDIQFAESLGHLVRESAALLRADVAEQVGRRLTVLDKFEASRLFFAAGVRTPAAVRVIDASPHEIADRFGFPVVVKESVGYGGGRVSITHNIDDLVAAALGWGGEPRGIFYEQYVDGTKLDYAAAVSSAAIEQELAYRVTRWREPAGGASEVETIEGPRLIAFARKALEVVGCTGLVNMDIIRDNDGLDWLIDFNARAFGGSASFLATGIDTSEGYLRVIGQRTTPPACPSPTVGVRVQVFPTCLEDVIDSGNIARTALAFARESIPYLRWLGFRYWLSEALSTADAVRLARQEERLVRS